MVSLVKSLIDISKKHLVYSANQKTVEYTIHYTSILCFNKANSFTTNLWNQLLSEMGLLDYSKS